MGSLLFLPFEDGGAVDRFGRLDPGGWIALAALGLGATFGGYVTWSIALRDSSPRARCRTSTSCRRSPWPSAPSRSASRDPGLARLGGALVIGGVAIAQRGLDGRGSHPACIGAGSGDHVQLATVSLAAAAILACSPYHHFAGPDYRSGRGSSGATLRRCSHEPRSGPRAGARTTSWRRRHRSPCAQPNVCVRPGLAGPARRPAAARGRLARAVTPLAAATAAARRSPPVRARARHQYLVGFGGALRRPAATAHRTAHAHVRRSVRRPPPSTPTLSRSYAFRFPARCSGPSRSGSTSTCSSGQRTAVPDLVGGGKSTTTASPSPPARRARADDLGLRLARVSRSPDRRRARLDRRRTSASACSRGWVVRSA